MENLIRILALDQSLTNTGVCRLTHLPGGDVDRPEMLTETLSPLLRGGARLDWFYQWARANMAGMSLVVMEGYSFGSTNNREVMGELGGVLKLAAHRAGVPLVVSPPFCVKNFALPTARQAAQGKDEMLQAARDTYGLALPLKKQEHEADAAHLASLAFYYALGRDSLYPRRQAALQKMREAYPESCGAHPACHGNMTSSLKPVKPSSPKPVKPVKPNTVKRGVCG